MGADAFLFVFDHARYCAEIVPAFVRILTDGHIEEWLDQLQKKELEQLYGDLVPPSTYNFTTFGGTDLKAHCTYLDTEMASTLPPYLGSLDKADWSLRACKSRECEARARCPFIESQRKDPAAGDPEELLTLFELAVARRCLGVSQFLGRSIDVYWFWDLLDDLAVSQDDPIRRLLSLLGRRGFVVGYRWTVGTEGIHGWLSPDESAELSERLFCLPLPSYNQSFVDMSGFRGMGNLLENHQNLPPFVASRYEHAEASFTELSLSFVRTVCLLASREGKGVLWGNSIFTPASPA